MITEALPNAAAPQASSESLRPRPRPNLSGWRTARKFQRVGSQRYFDVAGSPAAPWGSIPTNKNGGALNDHAQPPFSLEY